MNYKNLLLSFLIVGYWSCQPDQVSRGQDLINLESRPDTLSIFGIHKISTSLYERDLAVSPDGEEMIYTLGNQKQTSRFLVKIEKQKGTWSEPKILSISGQYHDIEPFFSHDGRRLYFSSNRPVFNDLSRSDYNIWYSEKTDNDWSDPVALDSIINSKEDEFFPSVGESGNLYFTSVREDGIGREDIFISEFINGKYIQPKPMPSEINSEMFEFNAFVSPDEKLIVFSSYGRKDGLGGGDLYVSHKKENGSWSKSKNLGAKINSKYLDFSPFVDFKNGNLYFTSERFLDDKNTIQSVSDLKLQSQSVYNGFGNIFKISLENVIHQLE